MTSSPYRILHVIGRMDRAGAETLLVTILKSLDRTRYQFDFLVRSVEPGHYDAELTSLGCRIYRCPHRPDLPAFCKAAYEIMRHQGPYRAVHSHLHYFDGISLTLARAAGIPARISHSHSTSDGCGRSWARNAYRQLMRSLIRSSATHRVGVSSEAYSALFGDPYKPSPARIVARNGVSISQFEPANAVDLRLELNLPPEACLLGHVGRMIPVKNHEFLLRIFAEFRKLNPRAELVLAGDGPLRASIEALARDLKVEEYVHFLGIRNDVNAILQSLDGFVFPSHYEGLSVALIEAQAAGVFCLASKASRQDANIGCGLLQFLDIEEKPDVWAAKLAAHLRTPKPAWEVRAACLKSSGYDIAGIAETWMRIYEGDGQTSLVADGLRRSGERILGAHAGDLEPWR